MTETTTTGKQHNYQVNNVCVVELRLRLLLRLLLLLLLLLKLLMLYLISRLATNCSQLQTLLRFRAHNYYSYNDNRAYNYDDDG